MSRPASRESYGARSGFGSSRPTTPGSGLHVVEPQNQINYAGKPLHGSSKTLEEVMVNRRNFPSLFADPDSSVSQFLSRPNDDYLDPDVRRPWTSAGAPGPASHPEGSLREDGGPSAGAGAGGGAASGAEAHASAYDDDSDEEALFRGDDEETRKKRARRFKRGPLDVPGASSRGAARPSASDYAYFGAAGGHHVSGAKGRLMSGSATGGHLHGSVPGSAAGGRRPGSGPAGSNLGAPAALGGVPSGVATPVHWAHAPSGGPPGSAMSYGFGAASTSGMSMGMLPPGMGMGVMMPMPVGMGMTSFSQVPPLTAPASAAASLGSLELTPPPAGAPSSVGGASFTTGGGGGRRDLVTLREQCAALTQRLSQLEMVQTQALMQQSMPGSADPRGGGASAARSMRRARTAGATSRSRGRRDRGRAGSSASAASEARETARQKPLIAAAESKLGGVHGSLLQIGDLMQRLGQVYVNRGEVAEKQFVAASVIQALVQGFLTRARHRKMLHAMGRWRKRHARAMVLSYVTYNDKVEQIKQWTLQVQISRELRLRMTVLRSWHNHVATQSPLKKEQAAAAAKMFMSMQDRTMREILTRWRDTAWGKHSRKNIQAKYRKRYERVRLRLEEKAMKWAEKHGGTPARVSKDMILQELTLDAIREIKERMRLLSMRMPFQAWVEELLGPAIEKNKRASAYRRHKMYRRHWDAWREYYAKFAGVIERNEPLRLRFEQRQNMRKVTQHYRTTMLTKHLKAWAEYAKKSILAKQKSQGVMDQLCLRVLTAWKTRAHWQREARQLVMDQWREHSRRLYSVPFRAWFLWASAERRRKVTQNVLLNAWKRRKTRQQLYQTFKHWSHKAIYGKIEGLHSRSELVRSLEEQKRHAHALETALKECQATLKQCEEALQAEVKMRSERDSHYQRKEEKAIEMQFSLDNAEAEVVRLQTMLDNVAKIHPGTVRHLQEISKDKDFKDRGLKDVTRFAVDERVKAEEEERKKREASADVFGGGMGGITGAGGGGGGGGGGGSAADLHGDDFLTGLTPHALPDLSLASAIFQDALPGQERADATRLRGGGDDDDDDGGYASGADTTGKAAGARAGKRRGRGRSRRGRRGRGGHGGDGGEEPSYDEIYLRQRLEGGRRRAWSVDLGTVRRITETTAPLPRATEDAPITRAPDGGARLARRRGSVVTERGDDGIVRVQARRGSSAKTGVAAQQAALAAATAGGLEARNTLAAERAVGMGGIMWVQAEDALALRRLKQVVTHLEETNHAKERVAKALRELADRRSKEREERERKKRLRNIMNKQRQARTGRAGGGGDGGGGSGSSADEGGEDGKADGSASSAAEDAAAADEEGLSDVDSDPDDRLPDDDGELVAVAGAQAKDSAATAGEEAAIDALVEAYQSTQGKMDVTAVARTRGVELKRWVAVWAYIMDGKRLWMSKKDEEAEARELRRRARAEATKAGRGGGEGGGGDGGSDGGSEGGDAFDDEMPEIPSSGGGRPSLTPAQLEARKAATAAAKARAEEAIVLKDVGDAESSTWGAFVQGVSYRYQTKHPDFQSTQERLDLRQTERRLDMVEKKRRLRQGVNLYKTSSFRA